MFLVDEFSARTMDLLLDIPSDSLDLSQGQPTLNDKKGGNTEDPPFLTKA
jgi:hypothetical protein